MKFFTSVTPISSCQSASSAYPCDAQDIPEPYHLLFFLYSKHNSQLPKSDDPNIAFEVLEIPFGEVGRSDPSISLQEHLYSMMEGTRYAYEYGLCSQHLSVFAHFQHYISEPTNPGNDVVRHQPKQHNGIWSTIPSDNSNYLSNVNSYDNPTFNKTKIFIETKVTAIKLQGFNL